jgi:hypothetical protein
VPEEFEESEESEFDLADDLVDLELPDNVLDETEEEMIVPEADIMPDEEEMEEDELFFDDQMEDEEEEDEEDWSARGRKKPKPGRQTKTPKSPKRSRREPRRGF